MLALRYGDELCRRQFALQQYTCGLVGTVVYHNFRVADDVDFLDDFFFMRGKGLVVLVGDGSHDGDFMRGRKHFGKKSALTGTVDAGFGEQDSAVDCVCHIPYGEREPDARVPATGASRNIAG